MSFKIVEFSDGLHVIPFSWLSDDDKQAYWPPYEDGWRICKAVVNMETPVARNWKLFDVSAILGSSDKYPEATEKLKLMKDASDLENFTTEETFKKTRARRHRKLQVTSADESEGEVSELALVQGATSKKKQTSSQNCNTLANFPKRPANFVSVIEDVIIRQANRQDSIMNQSSESIEPRAEDMSVKNSGTQRIAKDKTVDATKNSIEAPEFINLEEYHKELLRIMNKVISTLKNIDGRLKIIESSFIGKVVEPRRVQSDNDVNAEEDMLENILPMGTQAEFDEFEKRLEEKQFALRVVQFMRTIGGKDTHAFLFNVLKRCLRNSIAIEYSMDGKKKKKPLRPTRFLKTILKAVKLHRPTSDENEAMKIISLWLAGAKLRFVREEAKLQELNVPAEQNVPEEEP